MRAALALAALVWGLVPPAVASGPISPEAFEARAEGRTLHFTLDGLRYGSEQFFAGRRTLWQARDGICQTGRWYDEGGLVCFVYDRDPGPQCWRLRETAGQLRAVLVEGGVETGPDLALSGVSTEPLACPGPEVGS